MNWQEFKTKVEAAGVQPDSEIFFIEIENAVNDEDIVVQLLPGSRGFYVREAREQKYVRE